MTPEALLTELNRLNVKISLAGDKLHVEAPAGVLTPDLKEAMRQYKPALMTLLRGQARPQVISNVFCFDCFKKYGKKAQYQPHRVAAWGEDPDWLELTCTSCGAKCYMRDRWGGSAEGNKAGEQ